MDLEKFFNEITKLIHSISLLGQPNWIDYAQVVGSIISIVISAIAVIMAVKIPKKIADKQDKIALFDKRFRAYEVFAKYSAFADEIRNTSGVENYRNKFVYMFKLNNIDEFNGMEALRKLTQISEPIQHAVFLFENITDKELSALYESISFFVVAVSKNYNVEESKEKFVENADAFWGKHVEDMRRVLNTD